jgi:hypothetical protein
LRIVHSQSVKFEYDAARNILFADDDYQINTEQDADDFLSLYEKKMKDIGKKVYVVAHIDNINVAAPVYQYYGNKVKSFAEKWVLGLARWGTDSLSRLTIRASSIRAKYDINIFNSREEAVKAIEMMQDK